MSTPYWIAILAGPVALAMWVFTSFQRWKRSTLARLRGNARIVETSRGPVECAVSGEGPPVLISHGALGGYDQGLTCIAFGILDDGPYRFIAVSRPGYLRTLTEVGRTPEEQADAFATLLDVLKSRRRSWWEFLPEDAVIAICVAAREPVYGAPPGLSRYGTNIESNARRCRTFHARHDGGRFLGVVGARIGTKVPELALSFDSHCPKFVYPQWCFTGRVTGSSLFPPANA